MTSSNISKIETVYPAAAQLEAGGRSPLWPGFDSRSGNLKTSVNVWALEPTFVFSLFFPSPNQAPWPQKIKQSEL